jgi:hypothetical protein
MVEPPLPDPHATVGIPAPHRSPIAWTVGGDDELALVSSKLS